MTDFLHNLGRRIPTILFGAFILIQFFRPGVNSPPSRGLEIGKKFVVPAGIDELLRRSCYDCHSNQTLYPWYAYVQPVGWWIDDDINEGRGHLNFDEFLSYAPARQYRKLEEIREEVSENAMPLQSYTFIHRLSVLSPSDKFLIGRWTEMMQDSMKTWYPADSLMRRPPRGG